MEYTVIRIIMIQKGKKDITKGMDILIIYFQPSIGVISTYGENICVIEAIQKKK